MAPPPQVTEIDETDDIDRDKIDKLYDIEIGLSVYVLGFLIIFGVIGNICAFLTLQSRFFKHNRSKFLLCALAVADTGVLLTMAMHIWTSALTDYDLDIAEDSVGSCKVVYFFSEFFLLLSAWTLVLVTIERTITVVLPHRAHILCSQVRMIIAWCIVAVVIFLMDMHLLIVFDFHDLSELHGAEENETEIHCDFPADHIETLNDFVFYNNLITGCVVPSACMIVMNGIIIHRLRRKPQSEADVLAEGGSRKGRSVTIMLVVVSIVFVVCTLPMRLTDALADEFFPGYLHDEEVDAEFRFTITCLSLLYFTNNAINFLLYIAVGSRFRRAFKELFCFCCVKKQTAASHSDAAGNDAESISCTVLKSEADGNEVKNVEKSI